MGDLRALSSLAMAKAVISLTISLALLVVQCSSSPVWVQKAPNHVALPEALSRMQRSYLQMHRFVLARILAPRYPRQDVQLLRATRLLQGWREACLHSRQGMPVVLASGEQGVHVLRRNRLL